MFYLSLFKHNFATSWNMWLLKYCLVSKSAHTIKMLQKRSLTFHYLLTCVVEYKICTVPNTEDLFINLFLFCFLVSKSSAKIHEKSYWKLVFCVYLCFFSFCLNVTNIKTRFNTMLQNWQSRIFFKNKFYYGNIRLFQNILGWMNFSIISIKGALIIEYEK